MKPEEVTAVHSSPGDFSRSYQHKQSQVTPVKESSGKRFQTDKVASPRLDHIQINKLEASNSDSQDMAQAIRGVNQSLNSIDANLIQMKSALESIVKIYPPYPPGSSERIEALRQFSAFRQMIDQIAHPGGTRGLHNILGDPARNPNAGDWAAKIGNPKADFVIRHQPVHSGPTGLDLPDLDIETSDAQIMAAIDKTSSAMLTLNARHRAFIADANRIIARIL